MRVADTLVKYFVLAEGEVTGLGFGLNHLFFVHFLSVIILILVETESLVLLFLLLEHLLDQGRHVLGLKFLLDLCPYLHDGVLQSHFCRVANERLFVIFRTFSVVVEDVVEGYLVFRFKKLLFDVFLSNLKVGSSPDHVL